MNKPIIFGFYGKSKTGKTSLIEKIIKNLTIDGYKVATIKTTDKKISIDTVDKDTWRHSASGANLTVLSSPIETDFIIKKKISTMRIIKNISNFNSYDIILIEGAKDSFIDKIRLGDIKERDNTFINYQNNFKEIYKLMKDMIEKNIDYKISVKVNKTEIALTEFPANFIKSTVIGMVKSLKGVDKIEEIEINFKVK